jgi:hypothetical protein
LRRELCHLAVEASPALRGLGGGDQVEPVKPLLITVNTSSSDTSRQLSIS